MDYSNDYNNLNIAELEGEEKEKNDQEQKDFR